MHPRKNMCDLKTPNFDIYEKNNNFYCSYNSLTHTRAARPQINGLLPNASFFVICGKKGDNMTIGLYGRKIVKGTSIASVVIIPIAPVEFGLKKIFMRTMAKIKNYNFIIYNLNRL